MKRMIKAILRPFWRALLPIRRRALGKAYHLMVRANAEALAHADLAETFRAGVAESIRAECATAHDRILPAFHGRFDEVVRTAHQTTGAISAEIDLVLNSVVRELARLQMQVEVLQQLVQADAPRRDGLSLLDEAGEGHFVGGQRSEERMMVN